MLKRLQFNWPRRGMIGKLAWVGGVFGAGVLAFFCGRHAALSQGPDPTKPGATPAALSKLTPTTVDPSVYDQRVVGYVTFGDQRIPISREELGEYLITRLGPERLDFLINRKVIEMACASKGITVNDEQIAAQYAEDLKGFNVSEKDFVNVLLKRRGQTLYEWKEDVIRPRLLMTNYCRDMVAVTEDDIQNAFEARFGDKVQCRMIVLAKEQGQKHTAIWEKVRESDEEFRKMALQSCVQAIAARGGEVPPIHRHFADKSIEDEAFKLTPGMVGRLLQMPDGTAIILKCDKLLPRDTTRKLEEERVKLIEEIREVKLAQLVPLKFQELRDKADPKNFLRVEARQALTQQVPSQWSPQISKTPMSGN